jgi:asparagine synthase (glutamine-hydrolysing)
MRAFVLLLDPQDRGIPEAVRREYEAMPRRRRLKFQWRSFDHAAVLLMWNDGNGETLVEQHGPWVGVGNVRLDNRVDLEHWAACEGERLTDLGLVARVVARWGTRYISQMLGDFGFVVWNGDSRWAVAACDTFAVQPLYRAESGGLFALASRAEALALSERYDPEYLVRLVALHGPSRELSVYSGVLPVAAASMAVLNARGFSVSRYWSAMALEPRSSGAVSDAEAVAGFRGLLAESIRLRLGRDGETWAQLSGGLDSSSIVGLTQWLADRGKIGCGLAGTITFVDRQGTASDEREYSDPVVARWRLRNETIVEAPTWYDSLHPPPLGDQPGLDLQFYPRDSRLIDIVRASGGRVLLTGWGGDEVLASNMFFYADWIVEGQFRRAARDMTRRAAAGRVSVWELAYKNALLPLLPRAAQQVLVNDGFPVQPWLEHAALRRYGLARGTPTASEYAGRWGCKYRHAVVARLAALENLTNQSHLNDSLELRHPMLYRPLVEFAVRLTPSQRARPYAHRWVLREAMRGILPEKTRTRVSKQGTGSMLAWSLETERATLAPLLKAPILAELGVINPRRLRAAFEGILPPSERGQDRNATLASTLAVEAWLQMRSGKWPLRRSSHEYHDKQVSSPHVRVSKGEHYEEVIRSSTVPAER